MPWMRNRATTAGLVEELRALRAGHALSCDLPSMRCVGYRQAWRFIDGDIDAQALRDTGIAATRQLAKRQLTWLRSTALEMLDGDGPLPVAAAALRIERRLEPPAMA